MKLLILTFFVLFFLSPFRPSHKLTQGGQMRQADKILGEYPYESFISLSIDNIYKSQLVSSDNTDIMRSLLICIELLYMAIRTSISIQHTLYTGLELQIVALFGSPWTECCHNSDFFKIPLQGYRQYTFILSNFGIIE